MAREARPRDAAAGAGAGRRGAGLRLLAGVALLAAGAWPAPAAAQYFGRNKVQYETFNFRIMRAPRFDVYFYPPESLKVSDATRMAERWYTRHSVTLQETFDKTPLIFYANHPDFQQTNVLGGFISQGTGGATESGRNRVVMPFTGVYDEDDHVLGHEMVHVFQFNIAADPASGPPAAANRLPLWFTEGMAEYLSVGRQNPLTAMWMRDAALRNDLPTIDQLTNDTRYFPYRYGQALWAYIGGVWGDEAVGAIYRAALRVGYEEAIRQVTGFSTDTLSKRWLDAVRATYAPVLSGRTVPEEVGATVLPREGKETPGLMDISPAVSPDGRYVAFFTRRGIFTVDLYVADVQTGRIVKQLTGPNTDQHFDAISFINSAGAWSPDGRQFAFVTQVQGDNAISILDVASGAVTREIRVRGVGEITNPAWGPGGQIAFSGNSGGITDLYILDLGTERVRQLMRDRYADLQPSWSPDGRTIAFATDRGPGTDFQQLTFAPMRIALMDVATGAVRLLPLFEEGRQINPQWSPDGTALYFVADPDGFNDIYRTTLADGAIRRVTRVATGVSGITALSPAISVAMRTGRLVFSVFDVGGNTLRQLEAAEAQGVPLTAPPLGGAVAGVLPPVDARGRVELALADPTTGLPPTGTFPITPYRPRLSLEYLGSPGVGVAVGGPFGTQAAGGITGYFTDMLNNNIVGVTAQLQGQSLRDFGGQLLYLNQRRRTNYYTSASRIPILFGFGTLPRDTVLSGPGGDIPAVILRQYLQRLYINQLAAGVQYPFSLTRRVELGLTATRLGYFTQSYSQYYTEGGGFLGQDQRKEDSPPAVTYYQANAALVGDYSYFGFTSPVAGGRYRFEVSPTVGAVTFQSVLADYRRYLFVNPVTLALRGIGFARFGKDAESGRVAPLYLGYPTLVRGYDPYSFRPGDCTDNGTTASGCPELDRLIGSRIVVANAELRVPLFGAQGFGLINFPYLPTEIAPFVDAGVAWTSDSAPELAFRRNSTARVPVVSTGVTARFNVLGAMVVEVFYAIPFQRPSRRRGVFGFQLAPGW